MKSLKILAFVLLCALSISSGYGQRILKYKTIYQSVINEPNEKSYPMLVEYQRQDPFHANCYYQMALIADKWAREYDPFMDYDNIMFFTYNTNLYLGLALKYMDEKEANRMEGYYQGIKGTLKKGEISTEDIKLDIHKRITAIKIYEKKVIKLVSDFDSCVRNYNRCIVTFMDINKNDNKITDIYLTADQKLINNAKFLASSFDATLFYFDAYRKLLDTFPVKNYNQNYKLRSIETYRLEGLTASNFLENDIRLWDYGIWVKSLLSVLNTDISALREEVYKTDDALDQKLLELKTGEDKMDSTRSQILKYSFSNKISKYDFQSLLSSLLEYKQAKINVLSQTRNYLNYPMDTTEKVSFSKRAKFYKDLVDLRIAADSLNNLMMNRIEPRKIQKHNEFFTKRYGNSEGVKSYCEAEARDNSNIQEKFLENLKKSTIADLVNTGERDSFLIFENQKIPLFISKLDFENVKDQGFVTTYISKNKNGNMSIGGYIGKQGKKAVAFVAQTYRSKNIKWLKILGANANFNECACFTEMLDNGSIALINGSIQSKAKCTNILIRFDTEGNEVSKKELKAIEMPRFVSYDDINDRLVVAFNGMDLDATKCSSENFTLYSQQLKTDSVYWTKSFELKGNLVDIEKMDENLLVYCNFTRYINESGLPIVSKAQETDESSNVVCFIIDKAGKIIKSIPYFSDKSYYALKIEKLNSELINIIGIGGVPQGIYSTTNSDLGKLFYLLVNSDGKTIYSSIK